MTKELKVKLFKLATLIETAAREDDLLLLVNETHFLRELIFEIKQTELENNDPIKKTLEDYIDAFHK